MEPLSIERSDENPEDPFGVNEGDASRAIVNPLNTSARKEAPLTFTSRTPPPLLDLDEGVAIQKSPVPNPTNEVAHEAESQQGPPANPIGVAFQEPDAPENPAANPITEAFHAKEGSFLNEEGPPSEEPRSVPLTSRPPTHAGVLLHPSEIKEGEHPHSHLHAHFNGEPSASPPSQRRASSKGEGEPSASPPSQRRASSKGEGEPSASPPSQRRANSKGERDGELSSSPPSQRRANSKRDATGISEEGAPKKGLRFAESPSVAQSPAWKDLVMKDDEGSPKVKHPLPLVPLDERNRSFSGTVALNSSYRDETPHATPGPSRAHSHAGLRRSAENKSVEYSNESPYPSRPGTTKTWKVDPAQGPMTIQPWKQNKFSNRTGEYKGGELGGRRDSLVNHMLPVVKTPKSRRVHKKIPLVLWHGETAMDEYHSVVPTGKAIRRLQTSSSMRRSRKSLTKSQDEELEEVEEEYGATTMHMMRESDNELPFLMRKFPDLYRFLNRDRIAAADRIKRTGASDAELDDPDVKNARKVDVPVGFKTLEGPNWVFKRWPTARIVLAIAGLILGVACFIMSAAVAVPPKTPTPQGVVPSIYDRRCRTSADCVYMANCYQNYCINQATRRNPSYLKPNITEAECQAKFNCLSVTESSVSCVCLNGFCNNIKGCPVDKNAGRWVLIAIGVLLLFISLPALFMAKAYTLRFFDETKTLSYTRSYPALPCYGRRHKSGISVLDIEDVYSQQFLKTDRYSASSRHVQMRMPDGYVFTCFLGKVAIAEEEVIKWNEFLEDRRHYGEEPEDEQLEVLETNFDEVKDAKKREAKEWNDADLEVAQAFFFEKANDLEDNEPKDNWDAMIEEEKEINKKVDIEIQRRKSVDVEMQRRRSMAKAVEDDDSETERFPDHSENPSLHDDGPEARGEHFRERGRSPLDLSGDGDH